MPDRHLPIHLCEGCDFLWGPHSRADSSANPAASVNVDAGETVPEVEPRPPVCPWCGHRHRRAGSMSASSVLALCAGAALFLATAAFAPIVELSVLGTSAGTTIWDGAASLFPGTYGALAALVIVTCVVLPAIRIATYALLAYNALRARRRPRAGSTRYRGTAALVRLAHHTGGWVMLDIYLCAVGISAIKLADVAAVDVDIALLALAGAAICLTLVERGADLRGLFRDAADMGPVPAPMSTPAPAPDADDPHHARGHRLIECATCHTYYRDHDRCPACASPARRASHLAPQRLLALTLAGAIAYVPANLLPFVRVEQFGQVRTDTIASGVLGLVDDGMWFVAAVVFLASIVVPLAKIIGLLYLGIAASRRHASLAPAPGARARSRLLDALDATGRWSMIDIFIVVILASVVTFRPAVDFTLGPGAIAFALMVVFTLLATAAFDRRLLWRPAHA